MSDNYNADRVTYLAHEIMKHKRLYYAGRPEISDAAYDKLEAELTRLSPQHPVLSFVGSDKFIGLPKVEHAEPMLSLQKVYTEKELFAWLSGRDVVGTWKIDGNGLSVVYRDGRIEIAKTRGNGRVGEDVTEKVKWVSDIVPSLGDGYAMEIRGELYCAKENFMRLVEDMDALGLERPTNPRNIVAGLLGRKTHYDLARYFNFLVFDAIVDEAEAPFQTEIEKFKWLEQRGFRTPFPRLLKGEDEILSYLAEVKSHLEDGDIGLDGAVFSYNELALHRELGNTSHHPRYKMGFKWQGETQVSSIQSIAWATSRLGIVTPVAIIEPVYLSGAQITNVTLHNAEHVRAFNLKAGDQIEIVRSGEVIPKFLEVKESAPGEYVWPAACPSCESGLEFDGVRLKCPNELHCPAQQMGVILNWIRAVEIDDLSEKRLTNMMDLGLVKAIPDLYRLSVEDIMRLALTKERMAKKLFDNIQKRRELPLARFLYGLGVEGGGLTTWEKLLEHFPSLGRLLEASVEEIAAIDGFAEKSAVQIVNGLSRKRELIDGLLSVGVRPLEPSAATTARTPRSGPIVGKQIAITGSLSRPRGEIEQLIKEHGGKPASSVSKNTFALVTNDTDSGSSKMTKARELGIPIWSEAQLLEKLEKSPAD